MTPAQVRTALVRDPGLADLHLADRGTGWIGGDLLSIVVKLWNDDDHNLIDGGFETATVGAKVVPSGGPERFEAEHRVYAAILRSIPGDVCLASEDSAGPTLLRLGDVVYVDPDGFRPEDVTGFGYVPGRLVTGIPPGLAAARTQQPAPHPVSTAG